MKIKDKDLISEVHATLNVLHMCITLSEAGENPTRTIISIHSNAEGVAPHIIPIPSHAVANILKIVGHEILRDFKDNEEFRKQCNKDQLEELDRGFPKQPAN